MKMKIIQSAITPAQTKSDAPKTPICLSHNACQRIEKTATFSDPAPTCDDLNSKSI